MIRCILFRLEIRINLEIELNLDCKKKLLKFYNKFEK